MVIAAGSTGSMPATAKLLGVIARLERGAVVLPGLDLALDAKSWDGLDAGHPQFGLKKLLDAYGGGSRRCAADWHGSARAAGARDFAARDAAARPHHRCLARHRRTAARKTSPRTWKGIAAVEAADPAQEALIVALALRETLETENRTAALVTPDRTLARRVAGELGRWDIAIDDSAGRPLAHTGAGAFLCLLAEAAETQFAPVPLLALLKHPFATLGEDAPVFRAHARELDRLCLRGPRPDPGPCGESPRPSRARMPRRRTWRIGGNGVAAILAPLEEIFAAPQALLENLIAAHVAAAERLACEESEDCPLWRNDDGEAAAILIADFAESARRACRRSSRASIQPCCVHWR